MSPPRLPGRCLALLSFAAACAGDNKVTPVDTDPGDGLSGPQIEVTPDELWFDELDVGATQELTFTVSNVGDADLHVDSLSLYGSPAFELVSTTTTFVLAPAQGIDLVARYSPQAPEERAQLHIASDDVGNPDALVDLEGTGRFPELRITPDPLDFGSVLLGCSRTEPLTFTNVGHAPLTIEAFAQSGGAFSLVDPPVAPLVLDPGASVDLTLQLTPTYERAYTSQLSVTSNDTMGTQTAYQTGAGTKDGSMRDEFWQGDGPWERTDILFWVDQSGSMSDDQRRLQDNFASFADRLGALEMDWQVMVVTADAACHNEAILGPDTPSYVELFVDAVTGRGGEYTESGLTVTQEALEQAGPGGCNEGFLREHSKTMLVMVSDEVEQSLPGWSTRVPAILALAPNASITAIAGSVPDGCESADPGYGYWEASQATGGAFLSICDTDWAGYFDTIATLSATGQVDTFYLASEPDPATISVEVDAVPAPATDWTYDADANAVVFAPAALPAPGAHIVVDYVLGGDCEG